MATLAMACAENEGLQVVTEFPRLHGQLLGKPREQILTACLDGAKPGGTTSSHQLAEFLVYRRCNVDMLSGENIVALKDERAALADFRTKLDELAKTLPQAIHDEEALEERLRGTLNDMFEAWKKEQPNFGAASNRFFGKGLGSELKKIAEKLAEAALKPEAGMGGFIGGITGQTLTCAGAGFAIAVIFRAVESWREVRHKAKTSPLRYLTKLQEQGVTFSITQ
ncbi:MAG: hypothetical protein JO328_07405 [Hyphomicrobiales bacterium]|nr:hypothetical protein [Hyphomicrobiales bacterium]MBV8825932.1 hypothetical protein [Hyphomicrobiales bacterium]